MIKDATARPFISIQRCQWARCDSDSCLSVDFSSPNLDWALGLVVLIPWRSKEEGAVGTGPCRAVRVYSKAQELSPSGRRRRANRSAADAGRRIDHPLAARMAAKPADNGGLARTPAESALGVTWTGGRLWTTTEEYPKIS